MAKYKIGITEAGDAGLDLSWEPYVDNLDGVVLVTKNITPSFHDAALRNKEKQFCTLPLPATAIRRWSRRCRIPARRWLLW